MVRRSLVDLSGFEAGESSQRKGGSALDVAPMPVETPAMFAPKWKNNARHMVKGARKFIHYKRDLLDEGRIGEIESRQQDLIEAIKKGDKDAVEEASKQLRATCENSLPREKPIGWFEENVEVMFVAIVIALGLRAYYLQPFRIPTGSMQPTLNGITGHALAKEDWPSMPQRLIEKVLRGRSYVHIQTERDRRLAVRPVPNMPGRFTADVRNVQKWHFFSRSLLFFEDGKPMWLPAPQNPMMETGLGHALSIANKHGGVIPAGTTLCEGHVDTGDLVLVNKFAYHFRKPKRGETFVFDTQGIRGIDERSGEQAKGSHYIKRLCGVPGDTLEIREPHLLINGKIAKEKGIGRVMDTLGYQLAKKEPSGPGGRSFYQYLGNPDDRLHLRDKAKPGMREYAAFGDNTGNSLDSRYWGTVKEYNLVGPALFALWPITTGHWGFIE